MNNFLGFLMFFLLILGMLGSLIAVAYGYGLFDGFKNGR